ncbi:MAG: regulatory protein RecX [Chloroflexota bacterium]|nr:regulatory protein RecX [Chloroflexota bacterium]
MPEIAGHYFKEVRKGWTRVEFTDGESLELRREVFSEFGFGNGLTVTAEELQQALHQSHLRHGRAVALRFLRERPRSTLEIDRRLQCEELPAAAIAPVLEELTRQGHLNDADFARAWIVSRVDMRPKGMFLIRRELSEKGVAEAVIDAALERAYPDEIDVARPVAERRAADLADLDWRTFRQKLGAHLQRRGFARDTIERLVDETWEIHCDENKTDETDWPD